MYTEYFPLHRLIQFKHFKSQTISKKVENCHRTPLNSLQNIDTKQKVHRMRY